MKPVIKCHRVSKAVVFAEPDQHVVMTAQADGHYNASDPTWQDWIKWNIVVTDQDGDVIEVMTHSCPFVKIYEYLDICCVDAKRDTYDMLYPMGK